MSSPSTPGSRDELLDGEIFTSLREAQVIIESWRRHYNIIRPRGSIDYKPPAPEVFVPAFAAWPAATIVTLAPVSLTDRARCADVAVTMLVTPLASQSSQAAADNHVFAIDDALD